MESTQSDGESQSTIRQLLGIRDAATDTNKWKVRLQLTKPVTWAPLVWGKVGKCPQLLNVNAF